jgi:hypothetical protein
MVARSQALPAAKFSTFPKPAFASKFMFLSILCQNLFPLNLLMFTAGPSDAGPEAIKLASSSFSMWQNRLLALYAASTLIKVDSLTSTATLGAAWICSARVLLFSGLKDVDTDGYHRS